MKQLIKIGDKYVNIIMNASGCWVITKEQINNIANLKDNKTVITKTCTLKENKGNELPNYIKINETMCINSMGIPNMGYQYYRDLFPIYWKDDTTFIISMDASNWDNLKTMLLDYNKFIKNIKNNNYSRELVELNISCPNISKNGYKRRLISYDAETLEILLKNLKDLNLDYINFGMKLSPTPDIELINEISTVLNKFIDIVKYIVCSNTIPNNMILNTSGKPILSNKTGGISGLPCKLLSISNIYQYSQLIDKNIIIIGCGGIENINDIKDYLNAGAKCIQIGKLIYDNDYSIIEKLKKEFEI